MDRDKLLNAFITLRVMDDPLAMRKARVTLGTASFGEWWRDFWNLGPTQHEIDMAESSRKMHELIEEMGRGFASGREEPH